MTTAYNDVLDYTISPDGTIVHLIPSHPDVFDTLCGQNIRTGNGKTPWTYGYEGQSAAATCLPCRIADVTGRIAHDLANHDAEEGVDRCDCGCKYWERDVCVDCGGDWRPEYREDG